MDWDPQAQLTAFQACRMHCFLFRCLFEQRRVFVETLSYSFIFFNNDQYEQKTTFDNYYFLTFLQKGQHSLQGNRQDIIRPYIGPCLIPMLYNIK